ncbi:MAG: YdiU family protein [Planctomycetales bacterium]|nr:YdiU family protein [Planctomycetales bacterium]
MNGWNFDNTYAQLPELFFAQAQPARFRDPRIALFNENLAAELGLDLHGSLEDELAAVFSGQSIPTGAVPIAQAYAGHQFGGFTMLGDGRAILLGEHRTPDGRLVDIQFKGSGQTPYSRRGDGLAALGPMLREYLISEAMHALGIPTTRSLAVVTTGEPVYRERTLPGAILTRVAASHIRVGTFQYIAACRDLDNLRRFADYTISRHDSELASLPADEKYLAFFRAVMQRQSQLIAQWQLVGFVHGVMNTDNMAISGETIDYGPCAFLDVYHPNTVFSSIDHGGRYAYGNQPAIGQWNLARLAEALLPLIDEDQEVAIARATEVLHEYPAHFELAWLDGMRAKLGLRSSAPGDRELVDSLLDWMQANEADFTHTFDDLSTGRFLTDEYRDDESFQVWSETWRERLRQDGESPESVAPRMQTTNPALIPRNHRVEEALSAVMLGSDLGPLQSLVSALARPYERGEKTAALRAPPPPGFGPYRTFCGT